MRVRRKGRRGERINNNQKRDQGEETGEVRGRGGGGGKRKIR